MAPVRVVQHRACRRASHTTGSKVVRCDRHNIIVRTYVYVYVHVYVYVYVFVLVYVLEYGGFNHLDGAKTTSQDEGIAVASMSTLTSPRTHARMHTRAHHRYHDRARLLQ
jgi:hypothetical protein